MKHPFTLSVVVLPLLVFVAGVAIAPGALSQDKMFRCDNNYYTNSLTDPKALNCKPLEGGNVTVVQGLKPQPAPTVAANQPGNGVKVANAPQSGAQPNPRVEAGDQRARDSDARAILETELRRAETRKQELSQEFANGEPEKRGDESRNYQKYQERVAEMRTNLQRLDNDIAGIRRELGRFGASSATTLR